MELMEFIIYIIWAELFLLLTIPIHEAGHLVFGLLTKYKFSSFRIFSFIWLKEDGKIKFKVSKSFLIGQCIMSPPKEEKDFRFVLYNLGGGLFNLLAAFILFICIPLLNDNLKVFLIIGIMTNLLIALTNLIPMSFSIPNDGMNIVKALQSKQAKRGFFLMLHANDETVSGKRYRDLDESLFDIEEPADYNNYFVIYTVMCEAARLYDLGEYEKSFAQYDRLSLDKMQWYYKNNINAAILYHYIVHEPNIEKAKEIYSAKSIKKLLNLKMPTFTRILSAYEYFVNDNKEKGLKLLEEAKKAAANYPNKGVIIMETDYCLQLENLFLKGDDCH